MFTVLSLVFTVLSLVFTAVRWCSVPFAGVQCRSLMFS
ncbi:MAG: hypothetical protein QOH31_4833, partial [Verrucomicrobiota bacterium]